MKTSRHRKRCTLRITRRSSCARNPTTYWSGSAEVRNAWRVRTEEVEQAEGLKREITTVARGLRIEEQYIGERKEQGIEEEKSRDVGS